MKKLLCSAGLISLLALTACGENQEASSEDAESTSAESVEETNNGEEAADESTEETEDIEETVDNDWDHQVGDTNDDGSLLLLARNDSFDEIETGSMTLTLPQVTVSEVVEWPSEIAEFYEFEPTGIIQIDMELSNASEETILFYADQATITTSTGEQLEADFLASDHIDGDFIGAVNKSGSVRYMLKNSDPNEIEWVRVLIDAPHDEESFDNVGEKVDVQIDF
ncbi:hypothetical protein [Alkalicoccobacillus murimartini]|uniref:DUF4352 domain-containing protein n=1 Tax=Alkalicoccobacillus murimartini TaxID=171685 RepID=A0ABT9YFG8_9BACI|nr:hypothetical protein [Alkalicoccobacillus murimartini]MDQ0206250.1 hypothetical protein [Alkalicoccobacillus murimartini]